MFITCGLLCKGRKSSARQMSVIVTMFGAGDGMRGHSRANGELGSGGQAPGSTPGRRRTEPRCNQALLYFPGKHSASFTVPESKATHVA